MPEKLQAGDCLRLDPELRMCTKFDSTSTSKFRTAKPGEMGVLVVDDCAEEHTQ